MTARSAALQEPPGRGADGGEACICELTAPVGLAQPTVSHHKKLLADPAAARPA